jgi:hypothetical protein
VRVRSALSVGVILLIAACSSAPPTSGPPASGPVATLGPGQTRGPADQTPGPDPTAEPEVPQAPLPEPTLTEAGQIYEYLPMGGWLGEQAAVSLCKYLGIGIYKSDGTLILAGSESRRGDFFLYEDEVRALPAMAKGNFLAPDTTFQDFHDSLVHFGLELSTQDLYDRYQTAYRTNSNTPFGDLVYRAFPYDVSQPMTRFDAWLLFLDGFVPPNRPKASASDVGSPLALRGVRDVPVRAGIAQAGSGAAQWGLANIPLPHPITLPYTEDAADFPQLMAHLMIVAGQVGISISPRGSTMHEGHGGTGTPQTFEATVTSPGGSAWVSPTTLGFLWPAKSYTGALDGMTVTWTPSGNWQNHGSFSELSSALGAGNASSVTFTPRREAANGEGRLVSEGAVVVASVQASEAIEKMYGAPAGSLKGLLGGAVAKATARAKLVWHDTKTMHVRFTDDLDVGLDLLPVGGPQLFGATDTGTDVFDGDLVLQDDGNWRGVVTGTSNIAEHVAAFGSPCDTSWSGSQQIEIQGVYGSFREGNFKLLFTPITPPEFSKSPTCPKLTSSKNGIDYLPYFDSDYSSDTGWVVTVPDRPGGTWTKNWPTDAPPGSHYRRTTTFSVEYHDPPR